MDEFQRTTQYLKRSMEAYDENGNFAYPVKDQSEEAILLVAFDIPTMIATALVLSGFNTIGNIKSGILINKIKNEVGKGNFKDIENYFKSMQADADSLFMTPADTKSIINNILKPDTNLRVLLKGVIPAIFKNLTKFISHETGKHDLKKMLKLMLRIASSNYNKELITNKGIVGNLRFLCSFMVKGSILRSEPILRRNKLQSKIDNEQLNKEKCVELNKKLSKYNITKNGVSREVTAEQCLNTENHRESGICTICSKIYIDMKQPKLIALLKPINEALKTVN